MNLVQNGSAFSFNYTAYDQDSGLNVAFLIYDVTSGSAVFVQTVTGIYVNFGVYTGNYTGSFGKTYLIIGAVYLDPAFITVDVNRSPGAECYQVVSTDITDLAFNYTTYSQSPFLDLQASVYDMSSGTPIFVQTVPMAHVALGVYFGHFQGVVPKTYDVVSVVYTDNTFTTVDLNWSPGCDNLDCITVTAISNSFLSAVLVGQSTAAILEANDA